MERTEALEMSPCLRASSIAYLFLIKRENGSIISKRKLFVANQFSLSVVAL